MGTGLTAFSEIQVPQILMLQGGLGYLCVWPLFEDKTGYLNWTLEKLYTVHTLWGGWTVHMHGLR